MKIFIARDKDGLIYGYKHKPIRTENGWIESCKDSKFFNMGYNHSLLSDAEIYPSWDSEPIEVRVSLSKYNDTKNGILITEGELLSLGFEVFDSVCDIDYYIKDRIIVMPSRNWAYYGERQYRLTTKEVYDKCTSSQHLSMFKTVDESGDWNKSKSSSLKSVIYLHELQDFFIEYTGGKLDLKSPKSNSFFEGQLLYYEVSGGQIFNAEILSVGKKNLSVKIDGKIKKVPKDTLLCKEKQDGCEYEFSLYKHPQDMFNDDQRMDEDY